MPRGMDVEGDTTASESTFECLACGHMVCVVGHPGRCERCGGILQNRAKSLE